MNKLFLQKSCLLVILVTFCFQPVKAANWQLDGYLSQLFGYDDNWRLQQKKTGTFEYYLTPTLNFKRNDENLDLMGSLSYGLRQYSYSLYDNYPQNYNTTINYRTEQIVWGLSGSYNKSLTNSVAATDTGNFTTTSTSISEVVSPSMKYMLDSKNSVTFSGTYSTTNYTFGSGFSNNATKSSSLSYNHIWTKRLSQSLTALYSQSDFSSTLSRTSKTYSISTGLEYEFSKSWHFTSSFGERITDQNTPGEANTSNSGWTTQLSLSHKDKSSSENAGITRSITPSGLGVLSQQTSFNLGYNYIFTDRWSFGLTGGYLMTDYIGNSLTPNVATPSRTFINFQPKLNWAMDKNTDVSIYFVYRQQDSTYSSMSKALMLSFNYNWSGINFSR